MNKFPVLFNQALVRRNSLTAYTNAMRLVNGSADSLPGLTIDQYATHVAVHIFDASWLSHRREITEVLINQIKATCIIAKDRSQDKAANAEAIKTELWLEARAQTHVREGKVELAVDLNDGLNTGLFLDMRANRREIGQLSKDRRVLNLFSYTCVFGVQAATFGATEVVNVDVNKKVLQTGKENFVRNELGQGKFVPEDCRVYLSRLIKRKEKFDGIIIDPPSFARSKEGTFQIKRDLPGLIKDAGSILNPGGFLFVASNYSLLGYADIEKMIKDNSAMGFNKFKRMGQDIDFPGTNRQKDSYLVAVLAR